MCYMENKSLFFRRHEKRPNFFLQMFFMFNMITDSFLVKKWEAVERARRYACRNLLNLDCEGSIRFSIFQDA